MKEYFDFVDELAKNREDKVFFNSGPIHASIVMSRIFKYSNNIIRIFSGGFNGTVSNDKEYLYYLESFLKKGGKLKILVEDYNSNSKSKIYEILKQPKYINQIEIKQTSSRVNSVDIDTKETNPIHFTIGDENSIRIETNPKNYTAEVNFKSNDAKILIEIFENIFEQDNSKKLNLVIAA